jgi:protein TonB
VDIRFSVAPDGSVAAMEIVRSSGSALLDAAAEETVRRAAPYPAVPGWIRLPLSYQLEAQRP